MQDHLTTSPEIPAPTSVPIPQATFPSRVEILAQRQRVNERLAYDTRPCKNPYDNIQGNRDNVNDPLQQEAQGSVNINNNDHNEDI